MSKNKAITLICTILSFGAIIYIAQQKEFSNSTQTAITGQSTISTATIEHFQQQINKEEEQAWQLLQTNTHITKEECLKKQQKNSNFYESSLKKNWTYKRSHYPKLKQETVNFVEDILLDFDINPADIQIVPYKGQGSPAAADDKTIFIDEKEFALYSPDACRFFIAHEISHMQAQDDSIYQSLYSLSNRKKTPHQKKRTALEAFRRFQEKRADIYALLHGGEKYAPGAFDFFYKLQELDGGDNPGITHPKTSERIEVTQNICSMMGWNVAAVTA